jgi:putative DNA-invertase from lambdoid prophage Rac
LTVFIDIEKKGTKILSMSPSEDWTRTQVDAQRIFMAAMFAWFADIERRSLSERTKAGIVGARAKGKHIGRPFNEKLTLESGKKDYEKWKAKGMKPAQIARQMQIPQSTMYRYVAQWDDEDRIKQNEAAGVAQ